MDILYIGFDIEGVGGIATYSRYQIRALRELGHEVFVLSVDKTERRIGLSIKAANYSEEDIKKEAAAFDSAIKPGTELVGLEQAFAAAAEEYRPGEGKKK